MTNGTVLQNTVLCANMASILGCDVIKYILEDENKLVEGWDSRDIIFYVPRPYMAAVQEYINKRPVSLNYRVEELKC